MNLKKMDRIFSLKKFDLFLYLLAICACLCAQDYDPAFFDYSTQRGEPTAVAIIAYNRPEYFKQLLESLAKNPESQELPFFFFLDGGDRTAQEENSLKKISGSAIAST